MMSSSVMRKAFVISRLAENDYRNRVPQTAPAGVLELLAVNHHVVGQCVQPVVESFAALKKLPCGERHETAVLEVVSPRSIST